MRKMAVFTAVFLMLAGLISAVAYLQFGLRPGLIRAYVAAYAPPPTAVATSQARHEIWPPRLPAIGSSRACQGIDVAPQVGGVLTSIHVASGADVQQGAALFDIDTSVEEAELKNNLAVLKNADLVAAVYAPIGFVSGLTGALFREFAFTLAGSVIVSGVIALTLSPMMCARLLKRPNIRRAP
jgi:multidrug efflux pump subunit AcrA (membrane-fusion protein)